MGRRGRIYDWEVVGERERSLVKRAGHQWEWEVAYNRGRLSMRRVRSA